MILNLMYITTTKIICFIGLMLNYSSERQIYTIKDTFTLILQGIRIAFFLKFGHDIHLSYHINPCN